VFIIFASCINLAEKFGISSPPNCDPPKPAVAPRCRIWHLHLRPFTFPFLCSSTIHIFNLTSEQINPFPRAQSLQVRLVFPPLFSSAGPPTPPYRFFCRNLTGTIPRFMQQPPTKPRCSQHDCDRISSEIMRSFLHHFFPWNRPSREPAVFVRSWRILERAQSNNRPCCTYYSIKESGPGVEYFTSAVGLSCSHRDELRRRRGRRFNRARSRFWWYHIEQKNTEPVKNNGTRKRTLRCRC
jgi:hypothetical protein